MPQWVENKEESNQSAINTAAFMCCWGFCWVVISLWIHQLLPWSPQNPCRSTVQTVAAVGWRQRRGSTWGRELWLNSKLQHSPAVTQTSALLLGSTPRWSEESLKSSLLRQTYDVDGGGISLTGWSLDVDFAIEGAVNNHRRKDRRLKESLPGKPHLAPLGHFSSADLNSVIYKFPQKVAVVCLCLCVCVCVCVCACTLAFAATRRRMPLTYKMIYS